MVEIMENDSGKNDYNNINKLFFNPFNFSTLLSYGVRSGRNAKFTSYLFDAYVCVRRFVLLNILLENTQSL